MGMPAAICPRCGVRFDLPRRQRPDPVALRAARSHMGVGGVVRVQVNDTVVHQCQQRIDPVTGKRAWRPTRTVGADQPAI
jgi:hypothetical protein